MFKFLEERREQKEKKLRKKEILSGYPITLEYTLKDGSKYRIPAYWDNEKEQVEISYITKKDADAIMNTNPKKKPEIIVDKYDYVWINHIRDIDKMEEGDSMKMVEDGEIMFSQRFLLSLQHASDRDCEVGLVIGPVVKPPKVILDNYNDNW